MAIPTNIKTLLSGKAVEWARIEFKETWDGEASLKTVCAFANDIDNWGGGYIVIGVEEKEGCPVYPLKGVPDSKIDSYQKSILEKCKLLRPAYMPLVEVADYEKLKFIVLWCPGGDSRPYSCPKTMAKNNKERIHYIRKASSTIEPSDDEEKDLFNLANRVPFDDRVNHHADISDLNITLIQNYLKEVKSSLYEKARIGDFLKELHLTEGRNTGFKKILDALEANGSPRPEFETDEAHSYFITRLFIHRGFAEGKYGDESVSTPNSTSSILLPDGLQQMELREQILELIKKNPSISKKNMALILRVSMYALKMELAAMSDEHVAEFVGFSRNGRWVVYK